MKIYNLSDICQDKSLQNGVFLLSFLANIKKDETLSISEIAKNLNIGYYKTNQLLKKFIKHDIVFPEKRNKRSMKYWVNVKNLSKTSKSTFYKEFLSNSIDIYNQDISIINISNKNIYNNNNNNNIITKKEYIYISKENLTENEVKNVKNTEKVIRNGKLFYVINGKEYSFKKMIRIFVDGKESPDGMRLRSCARPRKAVSYYSPITETLILNIDFSKVESKHSADQKELKAIGLVKYALSETTFTKMKDWQILKLIRKYSAKKLFTKIFYIVRGIKENWFKTKIYSMYCYLNQCMKTAEDVEEKTTLEYKTDIDMKLEIPRTEECVYGFRTNIWLSNTIRKFYGMIGRRCTFQANGLEMGRKFRVIQTSGSHKNAEVWDDLYMFFTNLAPDTIISKKINCFGG